MTPEEGMVAPWWHPTKEMTNDDLNTFEGEYDNNSLSSCLEIYIPILIFLSDPSPIIGNACHSLTDSLTPSRLVNLMPANDDAV